MNKYTKFEVSILNGCGDIFDEKSERKKKEGKKIWRMPICNPTIQLVVANLYTKFEVSIFNGCGDIFDEKSGKKEIKNKYRDEQKKKARFHSHDITCRREPVYQI